MTKTQRDDLRRVNGLRKALGHSTLQYAMNRREASRHIQEIVGGLRPYLGESMEEAREGDMAFLGVVKG